VRSGSGYEGCGYRCFGHFAPPQTGESPFLPLFNHPTPFKNLSNILPLFNHPTPFKNLSNIPRVVPLFESRLLTSSTRTRRTASSAPVHTVHYLSI
jgi:hypothetical protein